MAAAIQSRKKGIRYASASPGAKKHLNQRIAGSGHHVIGGGRPNKKER